MLQHFKIKISISRELYHQKTKVTEQKTKLQTGIFSSYGNAVSNSCSYMECWTRDWYWPEADFSRSSKARIC